MGELSIDKVVADLTAVLAEVAPYSPEALKLAEIIRRLRGEDDERHSPSCAINRAFGVGPYIG